MAKLEKRWIATLEWCGKFTNISGKNAREVKNGIIKAIVDGDLAMHVSEFRTKVKLMKSPIKGLNWR